MADIGMLIYELLIRLSNLGLYCASFFSPKLKLLLNGRKTSFGLIKTLKKKHMHNRVLWFHCSSLGEFEQGRPLIEQIKRDKPECTVYLSFFSPSGFEIRKNYTGADCIFYLPSDTKHHARQLINLIKPDAFVLIKYDYWWNLLFEMNKNSIPVYLVSAVFRKEQYFLRSGMGIFLNLLQSFKAIFVQDENSFNILKSLEFHNIILNGDTRTDRVLEIVDSAIIDPAITEWCGDNKVIVYGSIWENDMPAITNFISNHLEYRHILVPHDISEPNVKKILSGLKASGGLYSASDFSFSILLIDSIGILNQLYKIADLAYVGGGFGKSIHNILEPAVFGIPVIFGPNFKKFNEAVILIEKGIAFSVQNSNELDHTACSLIENSEKIQSIKDASKLFFEQQKGATFRAVEIILKDLAL
jgi:3-deoxy-D-manno-octulosonic-acid transferase